MRKQSIIAIVTGCAVVLSACASTTTPTSGGTVSSAPTTASAASRPPFQTTEPLPSTTASASAAALSQQHWKAIEQVLADRRVDLATARVLSAEAVVWNDGSWGCPQRGMSYTQAQEPGMRVIVEADGQQFDFRFGNSMVPVLCEAAR